MKTCFISDRKSKIEKLRTVIVNKEKLQTFSKSNYKKSQFLKVNQEKSDHKKIIRSFLTVNSKKNRKTLKDEFSYG